MIPRRLDHVALYVGDPGAAAAAVRARLPFRTIEETDEFVVVGRDPELGKITFFRAPGPRERERLLRIGIGIPCATGSTSLELDEPVSIELCPSSPDGEVDLDHVALLVSDPAASARAWIELGFEPASRIGGVERVRLANAYLALYPGITGHSERPVLNHLGLLVDSFDEARRWAEESGLDVSRVVDGENSKALFVPGPDGVEVEYIEHKPSFALA